MQMNTRKYFIYARKSSEQEDRQVLSLESQIKELEALAREKKYNVIEVFAEAKSAKYPGREKFNSMLQRMSNGEAQGIITWHADRLSRNPVDTGQIIYGLDINQLSEVVTPGQVFINTPNDKFMLAMFMNQAKWENDNKGQNVKRGLKTKAEKGWLPSGAKAGYMNDKFAEKGSKTLLVDPERFPLIRKAWDCMLTGTYSVIQILRLLNEEWGYKTPVHKRIGGKPMTRSHIYKLFTDSFYYGEFEYPLGSGNWHQGKHETMITKEEFDKVQRLLGRKGRPRPRTRFFAYTGLLQCGECSATITAEEKFQIICSGCKYKFASQNKEACPKCKILIEQMNKPTLLHYTYYHCTKRKKPNCSQKSMRVEDLDKEFDKTLSKLQVSERFKDWAIKYINELSDKETEETVLTMKSLHITKVDIETRLNNLLKMKISPQNADGSMLNDEDYKKQKELLTLEKNKVEEQLGGNSYQAEHWREIAEKTFDFACHARYWFANGDTQTRREILAGLGSNLVLINKSVRVDIKKPLQFIEMAMSEEPSVSAMFEPVEKVDNTLQLEHVWANNSTLLPLVDMFRNREIEFGFSLHNIQTVFEAFKLNSIISSEYN